MATYKRTLQFEDGDYLLPSTMVDCVYNLDGQRLDNVIVVTDTDTSTPAEGLPPAIASQVIAGVTVNGAVIASLRRGLKAVYPRTKFDAVYNKDSESLSSLDDKRKFLNARGIYGRG
jgi:hypothetical protein